MKRILTRALLLTLSLALLILPVGCGQDDMVGTASGDFVFYELSDGTVGVGINPERRDAVETVSIPADFEEKPVTRVIGGGFANCPRLAGAVLPVGVTAVDAYAFSDCALLSSITLPETLFSIGGYAFSGCRSLEGVTVPNSVASMGAYAFSYCSGLRQITLSEDLTALPDYLFYGCAVLPSIDIPDAVTALGIGAFQNCSNLAQIHFGRSVESFAENTFTGCHAIASFTVDEQNTHFFAQSGILYNNPVTEIVYAPPKLAGDIVFPEGVTEIAASLFANTSGITSLTIPDSMMVIGAYAFSKCSTLTHVYFVTPTRWTAIYTPALLSKTELSDPVRAATYLRDTYARDRWVIGNHLQDLQ